MRLTLTALVLSLLSVTGAQAGQCVPFNSSVVLFDEWDNQNCPTQVAEAQKLGNKRINLLFTAQYRLDAGKNLVGYCFKTNRSKCDPVTPELLERLHGYWRACLKAAAERKLDLSIYLQIDDQADNGLWRNLLAFDPLQKYGGFSYDDILTRPLAQAVQAVAPPSTRVEFSLQGEMGATVAHYPQSYVELIRKTKERLSPLTAVTVGFNLNYTGVFGGPAPLHDEPSPAAVQKLIDATDFIGISAYHEVMVPIEADNFRFSFDMAWDEMKAFGVRVPPGKPRRISEIGMGGGNMSDDGITPAKTVEQLAESLWAGIRGPYDAARDPFRKNQLRDFRRSYFRELLKFLRNPPDDLNLTSAYLWNSDSWDVQGLYPITRGWEDATVIKAIREHNASCGG